MVNKSSLDLRVLSKELKLLLELLKSENNKSLEEKDFLEEIDWNYFLELVNHHRCHPLVYIKLENMGLESVPLEVMQTLYQQYKKNTFKMLQLSGEMESISKLFTENEIHILFLKGPAVAYDLYGDISLRVSKDLDVLISENDLGKAELLLLHLGYVKEEVPYILNERKWRKHHIEYFHPQKKIQIEIHWRLHNHPMKEPSFNELWKRKRVTPLTKYPVFILGEDDLFLHLVVHGARHAWFRLRWLVDIDRIIEKGINYKKTNLLIKKFRYSYLVGQAFILASELLNSPINHEMRFVKQGYIPRILAKKAYLYINASENFTYDIKYLLSLKSPLQKFLYIIILFYPRSWDAKTLKLPLPLHFLYFPLRPFLSIWRMIKRAISS